MKRLVAFLFLPLLTAFTFSPMSQSIYIEEGQKSAKYSLENNSKDKLAIEFSVKKRIMDQNGNETLEDTDALSIFPPQLIIPANEKRAIRVNWNKKKEIKVEEAYRVIAEQLPLEIGEKGVKKTGIQMLTKYMAALYLTPKDASSELKVIQIINEQNELKIHILNEGNKHKILAEPIIQIGSGDQTLALKAKDLQGLAGQNVLAKSLRIFTIKGTTKKIPSGPATIKVDD